MPPQAPPVENLEDANLSVLVTDAAGDNPIIYANPAFERLTGYERDELLGRNCRFLQGAGTDRDAVARLADALANRREIREVLLNYRKDGTLSWNELFIAPVRDENGLVVQFVGIQRDSTDRRRLVEELRRSEELHRSIIETAAEGICLIDARGLISFANPRLGEMLGVRLDSVVGTSYRRVVSSRRHARASGRSVRAPGTRGGRARRHRPAPSRRQCAVGIGVLDVDAGSGRQRRRRASDGRRHHRAPT